MHEILSKKEQNYVSESLKWLIVFAFEIFIYKFNTGSRGIISSSSVSIQLILIIFKCFSQNNIYPLYIDWTFFFAVSKNLWLSLDREWVFDTNFSKGSNIFCERSKPKSISGEPSILQQRPYQSSELKCNPIFCSYLCSIKCQKLYPLDKRNIQLQIDRIESRRVYLFFYSLEGDKILHILVSERWFEKHCFLYS